MGGFHKGHISLIKRSKNYSGKTLVSIFVNPKQFNEKKDYINYPRNLKKDLTILKRLKVDYVYLPNFRDIYSFKTKNKIFLHKFSKKLCGKSRKGHFKGVLNVVNRFLEIINPKYIFLGIKDFQQLNLVKLHILRRRINTKIIPCKTIREDNGIACSTRNNNLNSKQLYIASKVFRYLKIKKKLIKKNIFELKIKKIKRDLLDFGITKIDYLEIYNVRTLKKPRYKKENFNLFIAYYLNKIRLIDNF